MEDSILKTTKKILGIDAAYTAFDLDIITHINMVSSSKAMRRTGWTSSSTRFSGTL